jgi:hypothetical protein
MKRTQRLDPESHVQRAVKLVVSQLGSHDTRMHADPDIKRTCPDCGALPNERCASERYPSGRVMQYSPGLHAGRRA